MCPTYGKLGDKTIKCESFEDSNISDAESEANKETSMLLTMERMWNWPETFAVDDGWQDFRSEILLVDTTQVFKEDNHLVMNEHLVVQTNETLDYTMTETRKEHQSIAFKSNNETSEESSVQFEMLQQSAEIITVQQHVQQRKQFGATTLYASNLLIEEGNKCFEIVKSYGFVNEQPFALQEDWNEEALYQKLCHVAIKYDKPVNDDTKGETKPMNATFGKKPDFDFNVSIVDETLPSNNNVWNPWTGNGNSGMDAVAQANSFDGTQLSNGLRKQPKKRTWKFEINWNLIHGVEETGQLNENGIKDDTLWLHEFTDNSSVTRTEMCSLKVPTTASWSSGSCNGPATPFKTIWTQYGFFGKLKVFDDHSEPNRNPDVKKSEFCGETSSVTFFKQNGKRNSKAWQLLRENSDVATNNYVSVRKKQNVAQRLSSKYKSLPIRCTENAEHKGKMYSCRNVEMSLHLLIMMMDDSTTIQEEQIQNRIMERLENERSLTYLPHGQSTLKMKCLANQILGKWLEIFSTYLRIYSLDVEVTMEVELNQNWNLSQ